MIYNGMDASHIQYLVTERHKWGITKCDVVQMVFPWDTTWPHVEPVFQEFWAAYPEAKELHEKQLSDEISPEEEERQEELMQLWDLDSKCEPALAPFIQMINWQTGQLLSFNN